MNYNYGAIKRLKQTEPSLIEAVSFLLEPHSASWTMM